LTNKGFFQKSTIKYKNPNSIKAGPP